MMQRILVSLLESCSVHNLEPSFNKKEKDPQHHLRTCQATRSTALSMSSSRARWRI